MSNFVFNGSSRMRNMTLARDHHKSRTSILEDAQRQRLRREEDTRRTRAAQRLQRVVRRWLAGQEMVRRVLNNVSTLQSDVAHMVTEPTKAAAAEGHLAARFHTACWSLAYALAHSSRIPIYGIKPASSAPPQDNEISGKSNTFASLDELRAYQQQVAQHHGSCVYAAVQRCAQTTAAASAATPPSSASSLSASLWQPLLVSLSAHDVSLLLYVLLQEMAAKASPGVQLMPELIQSVVKTVVAHNTAFRNSFNEEETANHTTAQSAQESVSAATGSCCSLNATSPAYVDRWPAIQAVTMALRLACQPFVLEQVAVRTQYAQLLRPLLESFPPPPPLSAGATASSSTLADSASITLAVSSAFSAACWQCLCAPFSDDSYQLLTSDPLVVLLSAQEDVASNAGSPVLESRHTGAVPNRGSDACCALLIEECYRNTALNTRLSLGGDVNGIRGGSVRARVLGRLVRLMPHVQDLVTSTASYAAGVVKRYLLSVSCLSERLCRDETFIEGILADHYAYNTGQYAATVAFAQGSGSRPVAPRSQYQLLSSYLFSTEGGLRLMQLLTAEDEKKEQRRLQALQQPTMETPSDASPAVSDVSQAGAGEENEEEQTNALASPALGASVTSPLGGSRAARAAAWPTSASVLQSPLEILCNVFAWPLFTFSKPDYARYQQETLALYAKLVRTPQLLRRLWSLYWQSCEGLRAVLPPGSVLQKLCARPVWGRQEELAASEKQQQQQRTGGRHVPTAATAAPTLLAPLPRLPTWETHPRFPMAFYDPHPSLSIFLFTLLGHYVNVCDFTDELRRTDAGVFSTEEAYALILALKEIVHRAHMYGVVPDSNGEAVAHAACSLLARLHVANEADPFVPAGSEGLWMSVGMVAADAAVSSIVPRWDAASAAVVEEENVTAEDVDFAAGGQGSAAVLPKTTVVEANAPSSATDAVVLARRPGDDVMFWGSRSWDTKTRYIKLLVHVPFLMPFPARALLLSALLAEQDQMWTPPSERPAVVHRGRAFVDAFDLFHDNPMSANMMNIRFVAEDGTLEAGYGRGVYRECIVSLCKEGFAAEHGLFRQTPDGFVFPNSFSAVATSDSQHLQKIRFLGAMVGRALRDGVLQDVPFALHFRNAILGRRNTLSNLKGFDAELYHQLMSLTQLSEEALQAVGMTFVYTVNALGVTKEVELVRGGAQIEVTPRNCLYYVHLVADFKLNREAAEQTRAFCAGLHAVIDANRLRLFDSNEVGKLFGGDETGQIDLQDWKENTVYDTPEAAKTPQVRLFWDVVESLTRKQQSQLLKFATSMTRPPLLGFSFLAPPFKIQLLAANTSGQDHLPSAATCFSTLKLPPYQDYATARAKIIAAIEETNTFEFS